MLIEYDSNNSGGDWWLTDQDWKNLEAAGWKVKWFREERKTGAFKADKSGRWLGALARGASVERASIKEALLEFDTGQSVTEEGCNCCGAPHSFSCDGEYLGSGESLIPYLYGDKAPRSLREALERYGDDDDDDDE